MKEKADPSAALVSLKFNFNVCLAPLRLLDCVEIGPGLKTSLRGLRFI